MKVIIEPSGIYVQLRSNLCKTLKNYYCISIMWVLLGVSYDTAENEPFVYFIGIFDDLSIAKQERDKIITSSNSPNISNNYIIKKVTTNTVYSYDWSCNEEDDIKN